MLVSRQRNTCVSRSVAERRYVRFTFVLAIGFSRRCRHECVLLLTRSSCAVFMKAFCVRPDSEVGDSYALFSAADEASIVVQGAVRRSEEWKARIGTQLVGRGPYSWDWAAALRR
eukprot:IDg21554t1